MQTFTSLLEEALESWHWVRRGVIDEIRNLDDDDLAFRPHPKSRTPFELGHHIVEVAEMMCGELTRPDGDFRRKPYAKLVAEYAGHHQVPTRRSMLVTLLEKSHTAGARKLQDAGELLLLQYITRFDGKKGTRLAWLHHGIAHEEYHRGQIALIARMRGKTPALTKLIEGG